MTIMSDENKKVAPNSFDFNESDTKRSFPQLAEDFYQGAIIKAERRVCPFNDSNDIGVEITVAPMDAGGTLQKVNARKWYGIPVSNPAVPGHKVSEERRQWDGKDIGSDKDNYFRACREMIRAIEGDVLPAFAKKQQGGDTYFDPTTGEAMDKQAVRAREKKINMLTLQKVKDYYVAPEKLKDTILFFRVKHKKGFANISYLRHDAGDETPRTSDFSVIVAS
jgi:hypothetical protein